jgi:hypothetical protein
VSPPDAWWPPELWPTPEHLFHGAADACQDAIRVAPLVGVGAEAGDQYGYQDGKQDGSRDCRDTSRDFHGVVPTLWLGLMGVSELWGPRSVPVSERRCSSEAARCSEGRGVRRCGMAGNLARRQLSGLFCRRAGGAGRVAAGCMVTCGLMVDAGTPFPRCCRCAPGRDTRSPVGRRRGLRQATGTAPSAGVFVGVEWPEIWPGDNIAASGAHGAHGAHGAQSNSKRSSVGLRLP